MKTEAAFKLRNQEEMTGQLRAIGGTEDLRERFYPLLVKHAGKEATTQTVRDWLAGAIGEYTQTLPTNALRNIRRLMYINAGRFVDAMVVEAATATEIKAYFRAALLKL